MATLAVVDEHVAKMQDLRERAAVGQAAPSAKQVRAPFFAGGMGDTPP